MTKSFCVHSDHFQFQLQFWHSMTFHAIIFFYTNCQRYHCKSQKKHHCSFFHIQLFHINMDVKNIYSSNNFHESGRCLIHLNQKKIPLWSVFWSILVKISHDQPPGILKVLHTTEEYVTPKMIWQRLTLIINIWLMSLYPRDSYFVSNFFELISSIITFHLNNRI